MSLKNHPNFHAVKFATDITVSYYKSLRFPLDRMNFATEDSIRREILAFVERIEDLIDKAQQVASSEQVGE